MKLNEHFSSFFFFLKQTRISWTFSKGGGISFRAGYRRDRILG